MFSKRFSLNIRISYHAKARMLERQISEDIILDILETGTTKYKDDTHFWVFKSYADRDDNLLYIAAVIESVIVIKTVMHHFEME